MKTSIRILHWVPRIIVILAILFVSVFALDSFSSERTFWQNSAAFLLHLIPSFILIAILIVAWKWERTGGIILTIAGLVFSVSVFLLNYNRNHSAVKSFFIVLMVCIPFVIAGILFIISFYRKKKEPQSV
jgi:prolipoprotein diacylglyceryltransferase